MIHREYEAPEVLVENFVQIIVKNVERQKHNRNKFHKNQESVKTKNLKQGI